MKLSLLSSLLYSSITHTIIKLVDNSSTSFVLLFSLRGRSTATISTHPATTGIEAPWSRLVPSPQPRKECAMWRPGAPNAWRWHGYLAHDPTRASIQICPYRHGAHRKNLPPSRTTTRRTNTSMMTTTWSRNLRCSCLVAECST